VAKSGKKSTVNAAGNYTKPLLCVSAWLLPSKLAGKVESPDNGAPGKPKWLLSNTKLRAGVISNGPR